VNRDLVRGITLVGATGSHDGVRRVRDLCWKTLRGLRHKWEVILVVAVGGELNVEEVVGADTEHETLVDAIGLGRVVLEHNTSDVHLVRVKLGRGGDGVVTGLETGDRRDDLVEGNVPSGGVLGGRSCLKVVASSELKDFTELETTSTDDATVLSLLVDTLEESLSFGGRCVLGNVANDLATDQCGDVQVVAEDGAVSGGHWEGNLGEGWVEGSDIDDSVALLPETKGTEKAIDLNVGV
jgi:hypothetical protein